MERDLRVTEQLDAAAIQQMPWAGQTASQPLENGTRASASGRKSPTLPSRLVRNLNAALVPESDRVLDRLRSLDEVSLMNHVQKKEARCFSLTVTEESLMQTAELLGL
eukprot:m.9436 g.9436  ORF g.9436 m.9436 type:complete len:108 (+) comp4779_c0_seq2:38-361(+)